MTRFPSRMAVICASLSWLPSTASDPRMVRIRLIRRNRSDAACSRRMVNRPTASLILPTKVHDPRCMQWGALARRNEGPRALECMEVGTQRNIMKALRSRRATQPTTVSMME